jgi:hypothetical protein
MQAGMTMPLNKRMDMNMPINMSNKREESFLRTTYAQIGWQGFFRGWLPMALGGIPSQLVYFTVTESTR